MAVKSVKEEEVEENTAYEDAISKFWIENEANHFDDAFDDTPNPFGGYGN